MSAPLIIYNSRGGSTRRYAQLLASATGGSAVPMKEVRPGQMQAADTVVFASWLMAGNLQGGGFLKRHWRILKEKRTVLAAVGLLLTGIYYRRKWNHICKSRFNFFA